MPQLKAKEATQLLTIILHDVQSPLRFITTITQDLLTNYLVMDKDLLKEHITVLNNSVIALQHYCSKMYAWQKTDYNINDLNTPVNIGDIFIDIKKIYGPLINFKKIEFEIIEKDIICLLDKSAIFNIIINVIDNAFKNTEVGKIKLESKLEKDAISIIVSDTGKGMDEKTLSEILKNKSKIKTSNLGYYIINDLLKKINGTIEIVSYLSKGTTVKINLLNPEKFDSVSPN